MVTVNNVLPTCKIFWHVCIKMFWYIKQAFCILYNINKLRNLSSIPVNGLRFESRLLVTLPNSYLELSQWLATKSSPWLNFVLVTAILKICCVWFLRMAGGSRSQRGISLEILSICMEIVKRKDYGTKMKKI